MVAVLFQVVMSEPLRQDWVRARGIAHTQRCKRERQAPGGIKDPDAREVDKPGGCHWGRAG